MHAQTLHGINTETYERHFLFFSKVEKQKKRILVLYHYIE